MPTGNQYDRTYFENGVESGISGYQNYRWMPEQTIAMCSSIVEFASISKSDAILDYGCAKGFVVKGFTELGHDCVGVDISKYAIENADVSIREKLQLLEISDAHLKIAAMRKDVIVCKDVLEHVPYECIDDLVKSFCLCAPKLFAVVPLSANGKYVIPDYEKDVTHIIREEAVWWKQVFELAGYKVDFSTRVKGVKDNWAHYPNGNGFFLCTR